MLLKFIHDYPQLELSSDVEKRPVLNVSDFYVHSPGRRTGNTTRKIDATIQLLFLGYRVKWVNMFKSAVNDEFKTERSVLFKRMIQEHSFNRESEYWLRKYDLLLKFRGSEFYMELKNKKETEL